MLVFNCVGSFHVIDKVRRCGGGKSSGEANGMVSLWLQMTAKSVGDGLALSEQVFIFLKQFIRHHSPIIFATKETASTCIFFALHAIF